MTKLNTNVKLGTNSKTKRQYAKKAALQTVRKMKNKRIDPLTVNRNTFMSTYSNYNVSVGKIRDSMVICKPLLSNFRLKKYAVQGSNKGNKHNYTYIK